MLAGMYDERRGANVLPAATGGQSMQPVQPLHGVPGDFWVTQAGFTRWMLIIAGKLEVRRLTS